MASKSIWKRELESAEFTEEFNKPNGPRQNELQDVTRIARQIDKSAFV